MTLVRFPVRILEETRVKVLAALARRAWVVEHFTQELIWLVSEEHHASQGQEPRFTPARPT